MLIFLGLKTNLTHITHQLSWAKNPSEEERRSSCSDLYKASVPSQVQNIVFVFVFVFVQHCDRKICSYLAFQEQRLMFSPPPSEQMFSPPPRGQVPSQIHRRLLFAKSRSQAVSNVSKTESLKSSEASLALGLSPADSNKCIITLSSFEVLSLYHFLSKIVFVAGTQEAFYLFLSKHLKALQNSVSVRYCMPTHKKCGR